MLLAQIQFEFKADEVVACALAALSVYLAFGGAWCLWNGARSRHWPTVDGIVLDSDLRIQGSEYSAVSEDSGYSYNIRVHYAYTISGRRHIGKRVYFGQSLMWSSSADHSIRLNIRYNPGRHVRVYHHPSRHGRSVLEPGTSAKGWVALILGLLLIAIGIVALRRVSP